MREPGKLVLPIWLYPLVASPFFPELNFYVEEVQQSSKS